MLHLPCVYDTRPSDVNLHAKCLVDILIYRAYILQITYITLLAMGLSLVTVLDRKTTCFQSPVNKPALSVHFIVGASPFALAIGE